MLMNLMLLGSVIVSSAFLTGWVRRFALCNNLLDQPNHRSSHSIPTPRGGGLAIVVTLLLALIYLVLSDQIAGNVFLALCGGGALVAVIGYWDDRRDLSARTRLFGHFAAAIWAAFWVGGIDHLDLGFVIWYWGWLGYIVSVLGIIWLLNLYNFMDGIDGIAASEAAFAAGAGGLFLMNGGTDGLALASLALAGACIGFLFWNWPPAKIFMGDVGSGFLGYVLAVLLIASNHRIDASLWVWLLLLWVFVVDATVTLLRRLLHGEKVYEAHCCHAYQHATTLLGSHLKVTLGVLGINVFGLLPLALIAWNWPDLALVAIGVASLSLVAVALYFKAGVETRKEGGKPVFAAQKYAEIDSASSPR